jgi:dipeptidyl aminopeptidase/acylaminoacyl peptidase
MLRDNSHYWSPDGGYGAQIVVASVPSKGPGAETEGWEYSLWDPATGSITPEWTDAPGLQETYMQSDGDWLETVTRGFGGTAAMADWTIILRNLKTGEKRDIAKAQPGQAEINLTQITLQNDPDPSLADGKLVWGSAELIAGEGVQSTVQMYDIASGATTAVEIKTDHAREDLWSASTGGGKVAWLDGDGREFRIIILDVASGRKITLGADATASQAKLTPDGRYLVLETRDEGGSYDKYLIDVGTGEKKKIAGAQGWGVYSTTRYVSWDTSTMESTGYVPSGLYDLQTNELRPLIPDHTTLTNVGHVMGDWFIWQSMPLDPASSDLGHWYAMKLSP